MDFDSWWNSCVTTEAKKGIDRFYQKMRGLENILILANVFEDQEQLSKCKQKILSLQKQFIFSKLSKILGNDK